jgi:hypothetical protein
MQRPAGRAGSLQKAVAAYMIKCLIELREGKATGMHMEFPVILPGEGASDARASDTDAQVGGWWSDTQPPIKSKCRWFTLELTKERCPWGFGKAPKRRISSFELLGTALLIRLIAASAGRGATATTVTGITDSECNAYAMLRSYSKKLPAAWMHMQLSYWCQRYGMWPAVSHRRRELNQWADDLSNGLTEGWNPELEWRVPLHQGFVEVFDDPKFMYSAPG